jgi:hypothetical protein
MAPVGLTLWLGAKLDLLGLEGSNVVGEGGGKERIVPGVVTIVVVIVEDP